MDQRDGHQVQCPLCEGHGQIQRTSLIEKLSDSGLASKVARWLQELVRSQKQQANTEPVTVGCEGEFEREVHSWPPKRILWRRSPKE